MSASTAKKTSKKATSKRRKVGRPRKYGDETLERVYRLSLLGATDEQMAGILGVAVSTFYAWKNDFPQFSEAIKKGKEIADAEVAESMYNRARGYSHPEEKIFLHEGEPVRVQTIKHYPPDPTSGIFWLKTRHPDKWPEVHRIEATGKNGGPIETTSIDSEDLARRIAFILTKATKDKQSCR